MAIVVNMLYSGVGVQEDSLDAKGRQLISPKAAWDHIEYIENYTVVGKWLIGNHLRLGGIKTGVNCYSPFNIVPPIYYGTCNINSINAQTKENDESQN